MELRKTSSNLGCLPRHSPSDNSILPLNQISEGQLLPDIVEFGSSVFFCREADGVAEVEVTRYGACIGTASADYYTEDCSALGGVKYQSTKGTVTFAPGEYSQTIKVQLIDDDSFDTTLEFLLKLENARNAKLGEYLCSCHVLIIDDDAYPTNKFRDLLQAGKVWDLHPWSLMFEYYRMSWRNRQLRRACLVTFVTDQMENLKYAFGILATNYVVDDVLTNHTLRRSHATWHILTVLILYILQDLLILLLERLKATRRLYGMSVVIIQRNLLRKFLNYSEESRRVVTASDLMMSISRDAPELVKKGLLSCFTIVQRMGLLVVLAILALRQSLRVGLSIWYVFLLFCSFPIIVVSFLALRQPGTTRRRHDLFKREDVVVKFIQQTNDYFRLVADYELKHMLSAQFGDVLRNCCLAFTQSLVWQTTNLWFAPFVTTLLTGIFILLTFQDTMDGGPIGEFVTGITIWKSIGSVYNDIYDHLLLVEDALCALQLIVFHMNLPNDVENRKRHLEAILMHERGQRRTAREAFYGEGAQSGRANSRASYAVDLEKIKGANVNFSYVTSEGGRVLEDSSFSIAQGQLVAVTGPRGGGKATLLFLLGGVLQPVVHNKDFGGLYIPPHLRVLHVSYLPQVFQDMSLFDNLCLGPSVGDDEDSARVVRICQRLGMSDKAIKMMGSDQKISDGPLLSYTDLSLVHIARALVMNPEMLVMHKPLSHFDDGHAHAVLEYLRENVDARGVEKSEEEYSLRRPRTVVFSVETTTTTNVADVTLYVGKGKVEQVHMSEIRELRAFARELFAQMDVNGDNQIAYDEFRNVVLANPIAAELLGISGLQNGAEDEQNIRQVFRQVDHSGDGDVDFEELVDYLRRRFENHLPEVLDLFRRFRSQSVNNGRVSPCPSEPPRISVKSARGKGQAACPLPRADSSSWVGFDIAREMALANWSVPTEESDVPAVPLISELALSTAEAMLNLERMGEDRIHPRWEV